MVFATAFSLPTAHIVLANEVGTKPGSDSPDAFLQREGHDILKQFSAKADNALKEKISKVRLEFDQSDRPSSPYVTMENGKPTIHIGLMFLGFESFVDDGIVYEALIRTDPSGYVDLFKILKYANYLSKQSASNSENNATDPPAPYLSYLAFIGLSQQEQSDWMANMTSSAIYGPVHTASLAYVIGHELGHYVNGDLKLKAIGLKQEKAADTFSIELGYKAGFYPILALGAFTLLDQTEDKSGGDADSHPTAVCRAAFDIDATITVMKRLDPAMLSRITAPYTGQYAKAFEALPIKECAASATSFGVRASRPR